jgi:hypothetical protein
MISTSNAWRKTFLLTMRKRNSSKKAKPETAPKNRKDSRGEYTHKGKKIYEI